VDAEARCEAFGCPLAATRYRQPLHETVRLCEAHWAAWPVPLALDAQFWRVWAPRRPTADDLVRWAREVEAWIDAAQMTSSRTGPEAQP
jgi:hypothetical protein